MCRDTYLHAPSSGLIHDHPHRVFLGSHLCGVELIDHLGIPHRKTVVVYRLSEIPDSRLVQQTYHLFWIKLIARHQRDQVLVAEFFLVAVPFSLQHGATVLFALRLSRFRIHVRSPLARRIPLGQIAALVFALLTAKIHDVFIPVIANHRMRPPMVKEADLGIVEPLRDLIPRKALTCRLIYLVITGRCGLGRCKKASPSDYNNPNSLQPRFPKQDAPPFSVPPSGQDLSGNEQHNGLPEFGTPPKSLFPSTTTTARLAAVPATCSRASSFNASLP